MLITKCTECAWQEPFNAELLMVCPMCASSALILLEENDPNDFTIPMESDVEAAGVLQQDGERPTEVG
jgi:hypothetical protein